MSSGRKPITTKKIIMAVVVVIIAIVVLACLIAGALVYIHISEKKFKSKSDAEKLDYFYQLSLDNQSPSSMSKLASSVKEGVQTVATSASNIFKPASKDNDKLTTTTTLPTDVDGFMSTVANLACQLYTYSERNDLDSSNSSSGTSSRRSEDDKSSYITGMNSISSMLNQAYMNCGTINNNPPPCDEKTRRNSVNIIRSNIVKAIEIVDQYRKAHEFKDAFNLVFSEESTRNSTDTSTSTSTSTATSISNENTTPQSTKDKFIEAANYMNEVVGIINELYGTNVLGCSSLTNVQSTTQPRV